MTKFRTLALLVGILFAQPVIAQPGDSQTAPDTISIRVIHDDLDLQTPKGALALERRIWRAAVTVCGPYSDFDLAGKNDVRQCRRDTQAAASAQAGQFIAQTAKPRPVLVTAAH